MVYAWLSTRPWLVDGLFAAAVALPFVPASSAELAVYRIIQEALTNTMRHAGASEADVALDWTVPGRLTVSVHDNGSGPTPEWVEGRGLAGMRQRLEALGGELEVLTDHGFEIRGVLPA